MVYVKCGFRFVKTQKGDKEFSLWMADCPLNLGTEAINILSSGLIAASIFMQNTTNQLRKINFTFYANPTIY